MTIAVTISDLLLNVIHLPFITKRTRGPWYSWLCGCLGGSCTPEDVDQVRREKVHEIMAAEFTEFLVPLAYGCLFAACRHGPNGGWMAGVRVSIWHYKAVDLQHMASSLALLISGDLLVGAFVFWVVWRYAATNMFAVASDTCRRYGICILFAYAFVLYHQFCITLVHCGMDFSFSPRSTWPATIESPGLSP